MPNPDILMFRSIRQIKYFLIFLLIAVVTGCASAKQNPYHYKKKKASVVNASQLGRNKYYFSTGYQKKLINTYKKKK
jgi:hypothetical protein